MELIGRPVESLQWMLRAIAFRTPKIPPVIPDGIYGQQTMAAVTAFQKNYDLPVTGVTDFATWDRIAAVYQEILVFLVPWEPIRPAVPVGATLQLGDALPCVYLVQALFVALGKQYGNVPAVDLSGQYDAATAAAVRWLQQIAALPQTGRLDAAAWQVLARLICVQLEQPPAADS